ncbi:Chloroperoxidase [Earliella scabrosa]|nr:Chloroperoxidase [Earliella scabrosa]
MDDTNPHQYIPPSPTDSRAPCPAMNSLANHGYLPRDGKNLTRTQLAAAIREVFNVSYAISVVFGILAVVLCGRWSGLSRVVDLQDLAAHNVVEHDASLLHPDAAAPDAKRAPVDVDRALLRELLSVKTGSKGGDSESLTLGDLCAWQVRRFAASRKLGRMHTLFAHAEVVLLYAAMGVRASRELPEKEPTAGEGLFDHVVPKRYIEQWFGDGRLPDGWTKPERPIGHSVLSGGIKEVERIEAGMTRESVAPGAAAARG